MHSLLKQVSRSFYLSLRLLPGPMREGTGLAYLLARASDTIADSENVRSQLRLEMLQRFQDQVQQGETHESWPSELLGQVGHPGEVELLVRMSELLEQLQKLPPVQQELVRDVIETITEGQRSDLERFGQERAEGATVLGSEADLVAYTYRVAGCVGEFWTLIGIETLGSRFSNRSTESLVEMGVNYGKGLQLINILRDLPQDLEAGRCYLPVNDTNDRKALMATYRDYCSRAKLLIEQGYEYSSQLKLRRLRMASVLPAMLAEQTLDRLKEASWQDLEAGIKVSRLTVYGCLLRALLY